jgi:hypothetical protein
MLARLLYVAACVIVPLLWGLGVWAVTQAIERRRPAPAPAKKPSMPDLEYYL